MITATLPDAAEEYLTWLVVEKGRALNTIAGYRHDLAQYCEFLDERGRSIDDATERDVIDLVHSLGRAGKCVVISSHVLDEVERFGSRVLVIVQGRLAAEGDFHAIRDLMDDRPLQVLVRSDRPRAIASRLVATPVALAVRIEDDAVIVDTAEIATFRQVVAQIAREERARIFEVRGLDDDLESVFRYLVEARR